ncbi:MAG: hypothetical protein NTX50_05735 [Candidatus Sumerlaeota bacterium]|nr:hypothetical protein [Candidatus Sumerlaeota bacterium]
MSNPLDDINDAFITLSSAMKVVRRVFDKRKNPVSKTAFNGKTIEEGYEMLDQAEERLKLLIAFSLFASFERTLRDHLANNLLPLQSATTTPAQLAQALYQFLVKGSDRWRMDDVEELFAPPALAQDIANAKGIRNFRQDVAHGKNPSAAVPPKTAYDQLSQFLRNAGLI